MVLNPCVWCSFHKKGQQLPLSYQASTRSSPVSTNLEEANQSFDDTVYMDEAMVVLNPCVWCSFHKKGQQLPLSYQASTRSSPVSTNLEENAYCQCLVLVLTSIYQGSGARRLLGKTNGHDDKIVLFGTETSLRHLAEADTFSVDGIFSVSIDLLPAVYYPCNEAQPSIANDLCIFTQQAKAIIQPCFYAAKICCPRSWPYS